MPLPARRSGSPRVRPASLKPSNFELAETEVPEPADGELVVRNTFMSVDPYMRGRMNAGKSYAAPYEIGQALWGGAVGEVVASRAERLRGGRHRPAPARLARVRARAGAATRSKVDAPRVPASAYLGVLGMPGLTAYVGLLDIARAARRATSSSSPAPRAPSARSRARSRSCAGTR